MYSLSIISFFVGSEEEENIEEDVDGEFMIPRTLQMFFEPDVDTSEEADAAGHIDIPQLPGPSSESQVDPGVSHGPTTLFDFNWRRYPREPISPAERREVFVGDSGPTMNGPLIRIIFSQKYGTVQSWGTLSPKQIYTPKNTRRTC